MNPSKQTIANLKTILRFIAITPIIWFATFGDNQICINFVYFFNFFVCLVLFGFLGAFDKIKENLSKDDIPNEYLYFVTWMVPVCIFIADGWMTSAILWFLTWTVAKARMSEFVKEQNDQQNNNT
jgi:hypothetical protein